MSTIPNCWFFQPISMPGIWILYDSFTFGYPRTWGFSLFEIRTEKQDLSLDKGLIGGIQPLFPDFVKFANFPKISSSSCLLLDWIIFVKIQKISKTVSAIVINVKIWSGYDYYWLLWKSETILQNFSYIFWFHNIYFYIYMAKLVIQVGIIKE